VEQQMPTLTAQLSSLADPASMSGDVLEASIREVTQLRAEAQQVSVTPAMTFFSGLHSLLSVLAQHRISLAAARVQAITDRLSVVRKLIHQWVERGRSERAAIGQALPAR
jgi:hypothetical protein